MRFLRVWTCIALAALALPASAGPIAHREVLPNGVVLLVAERPAIPIVVVRVYVRAGSVYDPADAGGLANLTADLLTRGTSKRTGPELDRAIEFVGGSLEGDAGQDGAAVGLSVLKKDLTLGLDLLAEVLLQPVFPEAELKRRSEEIAAGIQRSEQDPQTVAGRAIAELIFRGHPYSRPVLGTVESVRRLTRDQVVAFHRENYRPDGAIIAVVGDVTRDEIQRELMARLGSWTGPTASRPVIPQESKSRPLPTTSLWSTGAGAAARHEIGTGVIGGMLFATFFGLLLIPVFYVTVRRVLGDKLDEVTRKLHRPGDPGESETTNA